MIGHEHQRDVERLARRKRLERALHERRIADPRRVPRARVEQLEVVGHERPDSIRVLYMVLERSWGRLEHRLGEERVRVERAHHRADTRALLGSGARHACPHVRLARGVLARDAPAVERVGAEEPAERERGASERLRLRRVVGLSSWPSHHCSPRPRLCRPCSARQA